MSTSDQRSPEEKEQMRKFLELKPEIPSDLLSDKKVWELIPITEEQQARADEINRKNPGGDINDAQDLFENAQHISEEGANAHYHEPHQGSPK